MTKNVSYETQEEWVDIETAKSREIDASMPSSLMFQSCDNIVVVVVGLVVVVVVVVVNGSYSAAPYSSPDRECITKSQLIKIKHRQST